MKISVEKDRLEQEEKQAMVLLLKITMTRHNNM
jgi:hypothetical protein